MFAFFFVGAGRFELPTSWSRTKRSSRAEPRPDSTSIRKVIREYHCYWAVLINLPKAHKENTKLFQQNQNLSCNPGNLILLFNIEPTDPRVSSKPCQLTLGKPACILLH